jgi:hypothetical protein
MGWNFRRHRGNVDVVSAERPGADSDQATASRPSSLVKKACCGRQWRAHAPSIAIQGCVSKLDKSGDNGNSKVCYTTSSPQPYETSDADSVLRLHVEATLAP